METWEQNLEFKHYLDRLVNIISNNDVIASKVLKDEANAGFMHDKLSYRQVCAINNLIKSWVK